MGYVSVVSVVHSPWAETDGLSYYDIIEHSSDPKPRKGRKQNTEKQHNTHLSYTTSEIEKSCLFSPEVRVSAQTLLLSYGEVGVHLFGYIFLSEAFSVRTNRRSLPPCESKIPTSFLAAWDSPKLQLFSRCIGCSANACFCLCNGRVLRHVRRMCWQSEILLKRELWLLLISLNLFFQRVPCVLLVED